MASVYTHCYNFYLSILVISSPNLTTDPPLLTFQECALVLWSWFDSLSDHQAQTTTGWGLRLGLDEVNRGGSGGQCVVAVSSVHSKIRG